MLVPGQEEGDLSEQLGLPKPTTLTERLEQLTRASKVVLFMKGTPTEPRCGFSRKAIDVLREAFGEGSASQGIQNEGFSSFDILSDESVRAGLKEYSHWPTYPQLYVQGRFIGGLDIMKELHEEGELGDILKGE